MLAAVLGGAQALAHRYQMNIDGISYLDAADAWTRGDWGQALNAYWSPMYSWLLAVSNSVSSPPSESAAARVVNLLCLALAVGGAQLLFTELTRTRGTELPLPVSVGIAAGILALWACLVLLGVVLLTPDLLAAGFALIALALLLRATRDDAASRHPRTYLALGLVLGAGYLAKAAMFPVALLALCVLAVKTWTRPRGVRGPLIALAAFAIVAAPLAIAISIKQGRPTFGESGRLNYAFFIGRVPNMALWRGVPPDNGVPTHPTRQVWRDPAAFEFATPVTATYAPWYDPAYWYEGVRPRLNTGAHLRILRAHAPLLFHLLWPASAALALVLLAGGAAGETLRALRESWPVAIVSAGGVAMYAILYLEDRYIGGFVLALCLWILASLRAQPARAPFVIGIAAVLLAAVPMRELWGRADRDMYTATALLTGRWRDDNVEYHVAEALHRAGIARGERIAHIETGARSYWARLAGVRIVADVPDREALAFWNRAPATRDSILAAMAAASGATVVIAGEPPSHVDASGWQQLGLKGLIYRRLRTEP